MLIAIDASRAVATEPTGTEYYSARIIEYLAKIDKVNTFHLYTPTPPPLSFPKLPANFIWRIIPMKRLWTHLRLSWAMFRDRPDILFVPAHVLPLYHPKKTVVTLHDVAYEVFPDAYTPFGLWYQRFATKWALRQATVIITPSEATKKDLIKIYNSEGAKIRAIHHGFDAPRFNGKTSQSARIKALQPYFLTIGRLETRKNSARTIAAYGQLRVKNPNIRFKLVLIGREGNGYDKVIEAIHALPTEISKDIIQLGYLVEGEVNEYLKGSTIFLYPSLYEGFGLPLLEAMAAGVPIVTSDSSSIPEVVDDAAILVDPESTDELVKAMAILALDNLTRTQFRQKGLKRARHFSWEKAAEKTHRLLMKI